LDETGLLMDPVVRTTWGRRGHTPILQHKMRHRSKISAIGAVSLSPQRRHLGLYLAWHPDQNVQQPQVIDFLASLLRHLKGRLIVLWDRGKPHLGQQTQAWLARHPRIVVEELPAYAPELNAADQLWSDLKGHDLANHGLLDLASLQREAQRSRQRIGPRQDLLKGFVRHTHLPLRLPP